MNLTRKFSVAVSQAGGITQKKLRRLKGRRWKYPLSLERRYATAISRYLKKQWKEYAKIALAMMVPRSDAIDLEDSVTKGPAIGAIVTIAEDFDKFNKKEMDAFREIAVGDAFLQDEPWVQETLQRWSREQVSLITKASQDMKDSVAKRVRNGIKKGMLNTEISSLVLQEMPGISFRRARIIARDQASKLNAELTRGRMSDAGLETYVWETAMDERVRGLPGGRYPNALPSHWIMQGKVCRWDDPTLWRNAQGEWEKRPSNAPYSHPGTEIMCRCVALPNWDELIEIPSAGPEMQAQAEIEKSQNAVLKAATAAGYVNPASPAYDTFAKESKRARKKLQSVLARTAK